MDDKSPMKFCYRPGQGLALVMTAEERNENLCRDSLEFLDPIGLENKELRKAALKVQNVPESERIIDII